MGIRFLDPSEVPNILFAKYDDRHQIRIFFPRLIDADREAFLVNQLSREEASLLWRDVIRPAFAYAAPTLVKDWPVSLEAERWRAKNKGVGYQLSTYLLSSAILPFFKDKVSERLNLIPEFRDAVFCTHIQGVKADYPHEMFPDDAERTLATMLKDLDTSEGHWWVDVGIELQDGGQALLWRETAAASIMSYVLQIPIAQAGVIKNSREFQSNKNSHLEEIAGFHIAFRTPTGPFEATYMQVYTTDKSLTFHRNGNQFAQNLTLREAMGGLPPAYLSNYLDVLNEAAEKNVAARVEGRVPLNYAETFLMDFDMDVIRNSIISCKRENFWNHRALKIHAMTILFSALNSLTREQILLPPVLSLYAVAIWYTNGVHSRPNDGSSGRECKSVGVPWFDDYDRDLLLNAGYTEASLNTLARRNEGQPFSPFNVTWLRRIYFRPEANVVRMPMIRHLQPALYKKVFGKTELELKTLYGSTSIVRRRDLPKERYPANKGMSREFNGKVPDNQPTFPMLEDVVDEPITITGPDVQTADNTMYIAPDKTVVEKVQSILLQFPSCVLQKIGNPKSFYEPSYCRLSQEARQRVTFRVMRTRNMAYPFTRVQVMVADEKAWLSACAAFFPEKGRCANPSSQGWAGMLYYNDWIDLMKSLDEEDAAKVRTAVFEVLEHVTWLPKATNDRPVRTNRQGAPWRTLPSSAANQPAPLIYLSPYFDGPWRWSPGDPLTDDEEDGNDVQIIEAEDDEAPGGNAAARREEEEESEDDEDAAERRAPGGNAAARREEEESDEEDRQHSQANVNHHSSEEDEGHRGGAPSRASSAAGSVAASQRAHSDTSNDRRQAPTPQASQRRTSTPSTQQDIRQFLAPRVSPTASDTARMRPNVSGLQADVDRMTLSNGPLASTSAAVDRGEGSSRGATKRRRLDEATLEHNKRKIERLKRLNAQGVHERMIERRREEEEESGDDDESGGGYISL